MTRTLALLVIAALPLAACNTTTKHSLRAEGASQAHLERFMGLAGEWVSLDENGERGMEVTHVYEVTAGGSVVLETFGPGKPHEMITMYHLDGDDLVLKHYCALGNQPEMRSVPASEENVVRFQFSGGTNMDAGKDSHMHTAEFIFHDKNRVESAWTLYKDGEPTDTHGSTMVRVGT